MHHVFSLKQLSNTSQKVHVWVKLDEVIFWHIQELSQYIYCIVDNLAKLQCSHLTISENFILRNNHSSAHLSSEMLFSKVQPFFSFFLANLSPYSLCIWVYFKKSPPVSRS